MLQEYLAQLNSLNKDWKNEIPKHVLHGGMKYKKYKCRVNWFHGVYSSISTGLNLGYISDPKIEDAYEKFKEYAKETGLGSRLTTSEDIDKMDRVLLMAIEHVSQKLTKIPKAD